MSRLLDFENLEARQLKTTSVDITIDPGVDPAMIDITRPGDPVGIVADVDITKSGEEFGASISPRPS